MHYAFLEESGDLGFSKNSSKWFVFVLVIVDDPRILENIAKKVWRSVGKKRKRKSELHAFHETESTRKKMFKLLEETSGINIHTMIISKEKLAQDKSSLNPEFLYRNLAGIFLRSIDWSRDQDIEMYVDRRDNSKYLTGLFLKELKEASKKKFSLHKLELCASYDNKSLQVVDFIAWAIFRKHERNDDHYYEMIQDQIVSELRFPCK